MRLRGTGMDRQQLLNVLIEKGYSKPYLNGLKTEHLERIVNTFETKGEDGSEAKAVGLLPGEVSGKYHVYCIQFEDGAAYVGMTGQSIEERINDHFGAIQGNPAYLPDLEFAAEHGIGTAAIVQRAVKGVAYRIQCLAFADTEREIRRIEYEEIAKLDKPLNGNGPVGVWNDPLAPKVCNAALARLRYGVEV